MLQGTARKQPLGSRTTCAQQMFQHTTGSQSWHLKLHRFSKHDMLQTANCDLRPATCNVHKVSDCIFYMWKQVACQYA